VKRSLRARIRRRFVALFLDPLIGFWRHVESFWKEKRRPLLVVFLLTVVVVVLELLGPLESMESFLLEFAQRAGSLISERFPREELCSSRIRLVEITDDNYKNWFNSQSPLSPEVLLQLILGIRDQGIRERRHLLIGVDFDTRDARWQLAVDPECSPQTLKCFLAADRPPIIWAQVPDGRPDDIEKGSFKLGAVLGGLYKGRKNRMGIPLFPTYPDGAIRTYRGEFSVYESHKEGDTETETYAGEKMLSLSRAIALTYCPKLKLSEKEVLLSFHKESERPAVTSDVDYLLKNRCRVVNYSKILSDKASDRTEPLRNFAMKCANELAAEHKEGGPEPEQKKLTDAPSNGKSISDTPDEIVIVGGAFEAARDKYRTPIGELRGVELVKQAVDSDLNGGGIPIVGWWYGAFLDLVLGSGIVILHYLLEDRWPWYALISGLAVLLVIIFVCVALVVFKIFWLNVIPVAVGVNLHQLWDHGTELYRQQYPSIG
jgi:hypothetical protein